MKILLSFQFLGKIILRAALFRGTLITTEYHKTLRCIFSIFTPNFRDCFKRSSKSFQGEMGFKNSGKIYFFIISDDQNN